MKKYIIIILIFGCANNSQDQNRKTASITQTGNFKYCHVNTSGYHQCNYKSLEKCNHARRYLEGICVKNEI
ncbi:MAG: hypothetical protein E2O68_03680 [Deltaproteobacteria bacterium]|nr:MAG: hypothetical protein E2O68_03680 [Deltaproteobacteria bacterium]